MNPEIFISYAWGDINEEGQSRELIVDEIYDNFKKLGFNIVRDKKDLKYKGNIKEFEDRLGKGDYIILVISDKFLKSKHCMFEVLKIVENNNIYNRIFPIILSDAKLFDDVDLLDYVDFWNNERSRLEQRIKKAKQIAHITNIQNQLKTFAEIARLFDDFAETLQKMNMLTPDIHKNTSFKDIEFAILKQIEQDNETRKNELSSNIQNKEKSHESISNVGIVSNGNIELKGKYVSGRDTIINK